MAKRADEVVMGTQKIASMSEKIQAEMYDIAKCWEENYFLQKWGKNLNCNRRLPRWKSKFLEIDIITCYKIK